MLVVGTIRSIEVHQTSKFGGLASRQVARISLDIEHAEDERGTRIEVGNLSGMHFQGPVELVPRFGAGERVQITTSMAGGMQISSIRAAPVS